MMITTGGEEGTRDSCQDQHCSAIINNKYHLLYIQSTSELVE